MDATQFSAERTQERLEISHRAYQFFRGADRKYYAMAREAFHPDAFDDHGPYKGGVDGLIAWLEERHRRSPSPTTMSETSSSNLPDRTMRCASPTG